MNNKKYIQTGTNTFKPITDNMRKEWREHNKKRELYFRNNVKITSIDPETGKKTIKNDPKRGVFDPYFDRFCDD